MGTDSPADLRGDREETYSPAASIADDRVAWPASARDSAAARPRDGAARTGGLRQLRVAVVVGFAAAAAIVLLAILFRPAPAATAPEAATALGSGPAPTPAAVGRAESETTPVAEASVRLRVGPDLPAPRRAALEAALAASGYLEVEVVAGLARIERPRVEYFHDFDRAAAEALSRSLAPLTFKPLDVAALVGPAPTEPGRLDVWIAD